MEINDNDYARLMQWVEQARRHIVALEQENRELRRQVGDLRRGVGMAIVVQGRVIPVNPSPADVPLPNAGPTPHPSFGPALQTSQQPQSASQYPSQLPQSQRPIPQAQPTPRPEVFSEELWITGQMRAVQAPTSAPAQRPIRSIRPITPSQEMTPSWLREDAPPAHASASTPFPTPPSAPRRTLAAATGSQPAIPKPRSQPQGPRSGPPNLQQTGRQRVSARPLSRDSAPLPSLAELTGQRPAVHIPGRQRQDPDERSPYSDSFVLD